MNEIHLLAIVEVPKSDRVICQAPGCNHPVYKRIHVVKRDDALQVLGSECFKKLFGESLSVPSYGSTEGKLLTPEERQLLIENTSRLIEKLEAEHLAAKKLKSFKPVAPEVVRATPLSTPSRLTNYAAELQAKQELRNEFGINPDLPGWSGLVQARMKELLR
ncbi:MAG: hypothetical protein Q7U91_00235 [Sideroxyarcus sp.]|nr:hypothetical protein [Sideroxyarcus sp.]